MRPLITSFALAFAGATMLAMHAQAQSETKTEVERGATPQLKVLSIKPTGGSC